MWHRRERDVSKECLNVCVRGEIGTGQGAGPEALLLKAAELSTQV